MWSTGTSSHVQIIRAESQEMKTKYRGIEDRKITPSIYQ